MLDNIISKEYDYALDKILLSCMRYLETGEREEYPKVLAMSVLLKLMKEDLDKLNSSFEFNDEFECFKYVNKCLTKITLSETIHSQAVFKITTVMKNQISSLLKNINMCIVIIEKIIKESEHDY